jgi:hypothetical protein
VNQALLAFVPQHLLAVVATLEMDATLIGTNKPDALPCYKGFKAYQPLNCWWPGVSLASWRLPCDTQAYANAGQPG